MAPWRRGAPRLDDERRAHAAASFGSDVPFFLAAVPALVEGRGERLTPLRGVHGHPGVLLVTPRSPSARRTCSQVFDAIRASGDGSIRMSSEHLAQELGNGLSATDFDRPRRRPRLGQRPAAGRRSSSRPELVA